METKTIWAFSVAGKLDHNGFDTKTQLEKVRKPI